MKILRIIDSLSSGAAQRQLVELVLLTDSASGLVYEYWCKEAGIRPTVDGGPAMLFGAGESRLGSHGDRVAILPLVVSMPCGKMTLPKPEEAICEDLLVSIGQRKRG
jgi:hypothetical protein